MIKQNKTKLQFVLGAILFLSVAIAACNNGDNKETVKDEPATIDTSKKNATDTPMVKETGGVSPVEETKPPK